MGIYRDNRQQHGARCKAGIDRARAEGVRLGRPPKGSPRHDRIGPLCLNCQARRVRRARPADNRFGTLRCVDGKVWRNYCSRFCAGESAQLHQTPELRARHTARIVTINRQQRIEAVRATLREALGDGAAQVPIAVALKIYTKAYDRGYYACYRKYRDPKRARVA